MPRGRKPGPKPKEEEKALGLARLLTIGVGALNLTRERAEKLVKEWEEEGEVRRKDMKKTVNELVKKGERERDDLRKTIDERVAELTKKIGVITKSDLEKITAKLERLEKRLK